MGLGSESQELFWSGLAPNTSSLCSVNYSLRKSRQRNSKPTTEMMFNSFLRLLVRSWSHLMTSFSMSTVGFVALSAVLPVVIYLALILIPAYFKGANGGFWRSVLARMKSSGLETIVSVGVFIAFWIVSLSVSLVQTIYNEH